MCETGRDDNGRGDGRGGRAVISLLLRDQVQKRNDHIWIRGSCNTSIFLQPLCPLNTDCPRNSIKPPKEYSRFFVHRHSR